MEILSGSDGLPHDLRGPLHFIGQEQPRLARFLFQPQNHGVGVLASNGIDNFIMLLPESAAFSICEF